MAATGERVRIGGPYFEDFEVGQVFDDAPGLTLTDGHAALHQALVGDRLRLPLDSALSREVTGGPGALMHPNLVCDVAIGQSTGPTQRVRGNLFYRGLVLLRPVFAGDTLRTRTEVVGLKQNRTGSGTGLVALRVQTENQRTEPVLDFWRCPMIPLRDPEAETGHADRFDGIPRELDMEEVEAAATTTSEWRLDAFAARAPGPRLAELTPGTIYEVEGRDTVTAAPELARLTLNVAMAHVDGGANANDRRLVYGGHTIAIAAAHVTRALPSLVTIVAWRSCDHLGPVFEGDVLATEVTVGTAYRLDRGSLLDLRALTSADRGEGPEPVLDWDLVGLMP